ncbi:unnamed protein product [Blepharisma stoltei]|uniref:Tetratricopeptide repeat protein 21A/21B C-terminal ARM domain-containing protein n=1 Tax=Blepharisma stoltei TaxID=1481888 RepID=A0AAU9JBD7_9CILI|nr:unnamed protein product [Blepharisma stoltei]
MGSKCSKSNNKPENSKSLSFSMGDVETGPDKGNSKKNSSKICILNESYTQLARIEEMLKQDPENPELNEEMGLYLYNKAKYEDSAPYFEKAIEFDGKLSMKSLMAVGDLETQKNQYEEAIEYYTKALSMDPSVAEIHERLGELYSKVKNQSESLNHLEEAVELDPKNCEYGTNLGLMYLNMHQYEESIKCFLKVLEINPEFPKAHNNLGNAYRKIGKPKEAIHHYLQAIECTPKRKFPIAHINLATTYFYTGDTISALRHFEEALQVGSNIHKVMVTKGYHLLFKNSKTKQGIECLLRQQYNEAASILQEVHQTDLENPVVNYYLGLTYSKLDDLKSANICFKKVIELGKKPIHKNKQFIKHFMRKAQKAIIDVTESGSEDNVVYEISDTSISLGPIRRSSEVFKVRAGGTYEFAPIKAPSPTESPEVSPNQSLVYESNDEKCDIF